MDGPAEKRRPTLVLYERRDCHLCEDMVDALEALRPRFGFDVERRDVDSDDRWRARYGALVPILFAGDHEVCRHFLDAVALGRALERS